MVKLPKKWPSYIMGFAKHAATGSKDSTQVGAVLTSTGDKPEVLLTAFNGLPRGVEHKPERDERPTKYLYAAHAEANLISLAARNGISTLGKTVVTTHFPCSSCAATLVQAGIVCVVYGDGKTHMRDESFDAGADILNEAGVKVVRVSDA